MPKWKHFRREHPVDQYNIITKNCSGSWDREEIIDIRHHYYAMIAEADAMLGEIMDSVDDDTVFFFTSDHGDLAMEHHQPGFNLFLKIF